MQILTLSYLYYFSRYLDAIINKLTQNIQDVETINICFYPSAYQYYLKNNKKAIPLYKLEIDRKKDITTSTYKGFDLNKLISFHVKLLNPDEIEIYKLKQEAVSLIDFYENLFNDYTFDYLLSFTENRMQVEIPIEFAKRNNVKIWYMEQGPYRTMTIDEEGVLANVSFTKKELIEKIDKKKLVDFFANVNKKHRVKYSIELTNKDRLVNIKDNVYYSPPKILNNIYPFYLRDNTSFKQKISFLISRKLLKKKTKNKRKVKLPDKFIALILQVPADAQMIVHSPLYNDFYSMLKDVYFNKPNGYVLVVREHPVYVGMYENKLYDFIENHNDIFLINDYPLSEFLMKADLVILNNSTTGLDALVLHKKVITLGNTYYNQENVVFHITDKQKLRQTILTALQKQVDEKAIDRFLYNLIFKFLVHNHFVDYEYENMDLLVSKIFNIKLKNKKQ